MSKNDVDGLIEYTNEQIMDLSKIITTGQDYRILVKNIVDNLRSILDYMAFDIALKLEIKTAKVYFPYGQQYNFFKKRIDSQFPNIKTVLPNVYRLIYKAQSFKKGPKWLSKLCRISNESKHSKLIVRNVEIIENAKLGKAILLEMNDSSEDNMKKGSLKVVGKPQKGTYFKYTDLDLPAFYSKLRRINHKGEKIDILSLLQFSYTEIKELADKIYPILS